MAKSSIFLDLDFMLIRSYSKRDFEQHPGLETILEGGKRIYNGIHTVLRPGAHQFLEDVSLHGNVYLFTAAQLGYAKSIIKAFELERYFDKFFTTVYHTPGSIAAEVGLHGNAWVLVEDSPTTSDTSMYKLASLGMTEEQVKTPGLIERHYVQVRPFQPHLEDTGGSLEGIADIVGQKIKYLEKRLILY
jgi:hypothetical protein